MTIEGTTVLNMSMKTGGKQVFVQRGIYRKEIKNTIALSIVKLQVYMIQIQKYQYIEEI